MNAHKQFLADGMPGSMSYSEYIALVEKLVEEKKTTGPNQTDFYVDLTKLNLQRMRRISKTTQLNEKLLTALDTSNQKNWILITEAWCGDAAQSVPVIDLMAQHNSDINLRIVLRDEFPQLIDEVLTNGGRSIPKLVAFDDQGELSFIWGPRPAPAQEMVTSYKHMPEPKKTYIEFSVDVQKWYGADATRTIQEEIATLLTEQHVNK
ncbi:MAG: thioredoxin family protein [Cryomorphaceae bacterium]|nr:thioredoxin family protein [Cryomorphaceae bacterium]